MANLLTPGGRALTKWLKHWKIASAVADGSAEAAPGGLTAEAKASEEHALKIIGNMIRAKYRKRTHRARRLCGAGRKAF